VVTIDRPPLLPAAACRPRGGLQMPGRESEGSPVSVVMLREEGMPLTLLVVLLARAAVLLMVPLLPGLRGVVWDVTVGAEIGMDRAVVMVTVVFGAWRWLCWADLWADGVLTLGCGAAWRLG
jgi:hypothetical protein